ncbi:MAG: extracellular solute-binding protein [Clostridia bacterium]|nr:extracellular solute-binding protein [Clostridia bacterium]
MRIKRIVLTASALAIAATSLTGCKETKKPIDLNASSPSIEIMTTANKTGSPGQESPVVQAIEDHLGKAMSEKYGKQYDQVILDLNWVISTAYGEKVTAALGAGEYPNVMLVTARNSSIIQNSKHGTFWDITDAFTKTDEKFVSEDNPEGYVYPNLAAANPVINKNISVDGKITGIYRARTIGREGITYRLDWCKKLHKQGILDFDVPETMDDLDAMMKAFTENDPDGDGQKNTYGMIVTSFLAGPLDNLAIWMGSPNGWGYDEETQEWKPWFMSEGYFAAMTKMREWYQAGYINKNMATMDPNDWDKEFLNGVGGIQIDVADRARRNASNIVEKNPDAEVDVIGYVIGDSGVARTLPTTGYNGYYVMPHKTVETEEELDFILSVLDECNGEEVVDLCNYGLEGVHYNLNANGRAEYVRDEDGNNYLSKDYQDLNQFSMGIRGDYQLKTEYVNKTAEKVQQVYDSNEEWAVNDPMAPYTSESYAMSGTQLDAIIAEAKTNYITGNLDEAGYKKAIEQWIKMDGALVCYDFTQAFEDDESNHDENGNLIIPDSAKYKFRF